MSTDLRSPEHRRAVGRREIDCAADVEKEAYGRGVNAGLTLATGVEWASKRPGMRLVIVESPYAGNVERNVAYARACVMDSLSRGEAPIASHLLYTQPGILRDDAPHERQWGIDAGLAWRAVADASVVYTNFGITAGMERGIAAVLEAGGVVEYRVLGGDHFAAFLRSIRQSDGR